MSPPASCAWMWPETHSSTKASARSLIPGSLLLQQRVALLSQSLKLFLLLRDAIGVAALVAGAGIGRGLLDELADIVARNGDAPFEFGKRKRIVVGHGVLPGVNFVGRISEA